MSGNWLVVHCNLKSKYDSVGEKGEKGEGEEGEEGGGEGREMRMRMEEREVMIHTD